MHCQSKPSYRRQWKPFRAEGYSTSGLSSVSFSMRSSLSLSRFFLWWVLTTTPITLCSPPPPISLDRYSAAIVKLLGLPFYCSLLALDTNAIMLNFKSAWMCASACCCCCVWLVASPLRWSPARPPAHHWNLPTPHGHLERMFLITDSARMYMYGKCPGKRERRETGGGGGM